jgi:hypothetical protein
LDLDRLTLTRIKINGRDVDMTEEHAVEAIVVCGVPGSGKTTFARGLASRLHWALLDLDTLTNPLFEYAGGEFLVDVPSPDLNVGRLSRSATPACSIRPGEPGARHQRDLGRALYLRADIPRKHGRGLPNTWDPRPQVHPPGWTHRPEKW